MPSSVIKNLSYDDQTRTLFVTFVDGDIYAYFEVPAEVWANFRRARSKGRHFAQEIRNRYPYRRMGGPGDPGAAEASPSGPNGGPASPPPAAAGR